MLLMMSQGFMVLNVMGITGSRPGAIAAGGRPLSSSMAAAPRSQLWRFCLFLCWALLSSAADLGTLQHPWCCIPAAAVCKVCERIGYIDYSGSL